MLKTTALALLALTVAGCGAIVSPKASKNEAFATAKYPPGGRILQVDGTPVHAVVMGEDHKPDLVMIHGASGNTRDFTFAFAGKMSQDYRVIVMDRPGFGHTGRINQNYEHGYSNQAESLSEQAALLSKAAAQLGADRPIVVGHSYGGAVGLAWALDHPAAGLVTLGGVSHPWEGGIGLLNTVNGSALGGGAIVPWLTAFVPSSYVSTVIDGIFAPDPVPEGYSKYVGADLSIRRSSLRANARQLRTLKAQVAEQSQRYGAINIPVEIVHGTQDTTVPIEIHAQIAVTQIPKARLTALEGVGHMPHHARPDEVAAAIDRIARRAKLK